MLNYAIKRLLGMVPIILGVSLGVFLLTTLIPGDAVDIMLGDEYSPELGAQLRSILGLDQPFWVRYWNWLKGLPFGDFGLTITGNEPVLDRILTALPISLQLAIMIALFGVITGIPIGIWSAVRQFRLTDDVLRLTSLIGLSVPPFWMGVLFLLFLSLYVPTYPILQYVPFFEDPWLNLQILAIPMLALGLSFSAVIVRMTRSCILEVMRLQFVTTARAKGLGERMILFKHCLRNAMIPVITIIGLRIGYLIGGMVIIEEIFGIPGMGRLIIFSISKRDIPLMLGVVFFVSFLFLLINFLVDLLYAFFDPRISYDTQSS